MLGGDYARLAAQRDPATCRHLWSESRSLNQYTSEVRCSACKALAVAKPKGAGLDAIFVAAAEYVSYRLAMLLARKGITVRVARAVLSDGLTGWMRCPTAHVQCGPWYHPCVILEHVGEHQRLPYLAQPEGYTWPSWLYWFDLWLGRLDSTGETNLLFMPDMTVMPVDFGMVFPWAIGHHTARRPDDLNIPAHPLVKDAASQESRAAIKSLTDREIWDAVVGSDIPYHLVPTALLAAWWTGLRLRRDLL